MNLTTFGQRNSPTYSTSATTHQLTLREPVMQQQQTREELFESLGVELARIDFDQVPGRTSKDRAGYELAC
ncbi:MAG: hypothetical protein M3313_04260 [Actinomycetota bacterium]|nr:hypothetical protein [Actinomycetota bacterium]